MTLPSIQVPHPDADKAFWTQIEGDLQIFTVHTRELTVRFLPQFGGRLISLESEGVEFLWRNSELLDRDLTPSIPLLHWDRFATNMTDWVNPGGSKTWPAPQGWDSPKAWAGPPDPIIDSGEWQLSWSRSANSTDVVLTSERDPRTGLKVSRHFSIPDHGKAFQQRTTFFNVAEADIEWAVWEVCQVPLELSTQARIEVLSDPPHAHHDLGSYIGRITVEADGDQLIVPMQQVVAKRGFSSASGKIAHRHASGARLQLEFSVEEGDYPDRGSRAEIWMQYPTAQPIAALAGFLPRTSYAEIEVLFPLTTLQPGEHATAEIVWRVTT